MNDSVETLRLLTLYRRLQSYCMSPYELSIG